jgi:hypothetical protein
MFIQCTCDMQRSLRSDVRPMNTRDLACLRHVGRKDREIDRATFDVATSVAHAHNATVKLPAAHEITQHLTGTMRLGDVCMCVCGGGGVISGVISVVISEVISGVISEVISGVISAVISGVKSEVISGVISGQNCTYEQELLL